MDHLAGKIYQQIHDHADGEPVVMEEILNALATCMSFIISAIPNKRDRAMTVIHVMERMTYAMESAIQEGAARPEFVGRGTLQ